MNRRTATLLVAAAAVGAGALGTSETGVAGTSPPPQPLGAVCGTVPEGLNLIIPHDGGVAAVRAAGAERLDAPITAAPTLAVRGPDGTVWVESAPEERIGVYRIPPGRSAALVAEGRVGLTGVGWLGGRSAAAVIDANGEVSPDDPAPIGTVFADFPDGSRFEFSEAIGWEWGVNTATIGADRVIERGSSEGFEWMSAFGPDGEPLEDWSLPFETEPDMPPDRWWPVAGSAVDGPQPTLSWAEPITQTTWNLVVTDGVTGRELQRVDLGEVGELPIHADFDGRFWVGTFADAQDPASGEWQPARIIAVDTAAAESAPVELACPAGKIATIDRLGVAEPVIPPTTTASPTTAAPTTTATGQCDEYVASDRAYPVRRCEQGIDVVVTQMMLNFHGAGLDIDGYFGPATEQAVRAFQANAGLEVDGLVGPDTFAALLTSAPPPVPDTDGNGTVDPWEMALDCVLDVSVPEWACAGESADS